MEKLENPTTTINELGMALPSNFTRILAHYRWDKRVMSSSTTTKPPQTSPSFLSNSWLHICKGRPNTLTHTSLAKPPLSKHPTLRIHSKCKTFTLSFLEPLASTLSASKLSSKSNKRFPQKLRSSPPSPSSPFPPLPFQDQILVMKLFNETTSNDKFETSPNHPTKHQCNCSSQHFTSLSPIWSRIAYPTTPKSLLLPSHICIKFQNLYFYRGYGSLSLS